jgi:hypothetical protein
MTINMGENQGEVLKKLNELYTHVNLRTRWFH